MNILYPTVQPLAMGKKRLVHKAAGSKLNR